MEIQLKYKILFVVGAVAFVYWHIWMGKNNDAKTQKQYDHLISKGKFDIGVVIGKNYRKSGSITNIMYKISFEDKKTRSHFLKSYKVSYLEKEVDKIWRTNFNDTEKGSKFLVLYEAENPKNSLLCLDMPIINDGDFEKYVKKIEILRE
ncbi:MAG: hypothetical protein DRJ05_07295 [Bacteroidetes bacterium]|nr:MAG: hypothetical protein DRJ05_07295 [Bacteroidota bacterium]